MHDEFEVELVAKMRPSGGGKRFGVTAAGDDHQGRPGRDGLAAIWIDEDNGLSQREGIKAAMRVPERRTYGVSFDGMWLDFRIDGAPLGSELTVPAGSDLSLDYEIREFPFAPGQTITVNVVNVLDPDYLQLANVPHFKEFDGPGIQSDPSTLIENVQEAAVYMLRVTNGSSLQIPNTAATLLWSTPIWVDVEP